jgi:hypothetical protein
MSSYLKEKSEEELLAILNFYFDRINELSSRNHNALFDFRLKKDCKEFLVLVDILLIKCPNLRAVGLTSQRAQFSLEKKIDLLLLNEMFNTCKMTIATTQSVSLNEAQPSLPSENSLIHTVPLPSQYQSNGSNHVLSEKNQSSISFFNTRKKPKKSLALFSSTFAICGLGLGCALGLGLAVVGGFLLGGPVGAALALGGVLAMGSVASTVTGLGIGFFDTQDQGKKKSFSSSYFSPVQRVESKRGILEPFPIMNMPKAFEF